MKKFIFIFLFFISGKIFSIVEINFSDEKLISFVNKNLSVVSANKKPNPLLNIFFKKQNKRKKIIATVLAFPIPGGILGLHRIYLGTKPYVPLVYIVTLGGGLLILPIIDFCVLLFNKDITRFENHAGIFMWIDNEKKSSEKKSETK